MNFKIHSNGTCKEESVDKTWKTFLDKLGDLLRLKRPLRKRGLERQVFKIITDISRYLTFWKKTSSWRLYTYQNVSNYVAHEMTDGYDRWILLKLFSKLPLTLLEGLPSQKLPPPRTSQKGWEDDFPIGFFFFCQVCVGEGSCSRSIQLHHLFGWKLPEVKCETCVVTPLNSWCLQWVQKTYDFALEQYDII